MRFQGKTALISGAGRNIGKAIALAFAREGADVILVARTATDVEQVATECKTLGVRALPIAADVSRHEAVNRVVQQGLAHFGKVDVLISVVGLRPHRPFWDFDYDEWQQIFNVNVHSTFFFAKALAPGMIERKSGSIVALGGMSSVTAMRPGISAVAASKHALYGLIKAMAVDLGPHRVRANLIAVGNIDTERRNPEWYLPGEEMRPEHQHLALRRNGVPDEVANAALFLASDEASYITGDRITCSGGRFPGM
jgi:NAD(P)-dependent dehydrogenase (short-subunit alcohol dehydrogenase family)